MSVRNMEEHDVISESFKMTELGPLSEEWEIESLARVWQIITGTTPRRMNQVMDEYKLENPIIEADGNWFNIIFKRPELEKESFESRGNSTPLKTPLKILTGLEKKVLNAINNDTSISRTGIARALNISPDTVKEYLERLKRKGVIKRIGPVKGGYWEVIEDEK